MYTNAPYNFHLKNNPAILIRNITSSLNGAVITIFSSLTIMRESLIVMFIFILLFLGEPLISATVFIFLTTVTGIFLFFTKKSLTVRGQLNQLEKANQLKTINHTLGSMRETKILNRENYMINLFIHQVNQIEKHGFYSYFISVTPRLFLELVAVFTVSIISIIFVLIKLSNEQILPTISLLAVCSVRLIPAFNSIISALAKRAFDRASVRIISKEFANVPVEYKSRNKNLIKEKINRKYSFKDQIKFENVFFSHENSNEKILQNICLEIRQGQKVGIIGKSGAGKSTLVDLILGLIKPTKGNIFVGDLNLNDNIKSWQRLIGYVPQDIYLLDDTIKNNIAFGLDVDKINQEAILRSIKLSKLDNYIGSLEQKENTIVGNRGTKVSGGEKQRIGIARALYHDPQVLIMDEATSSLDAMTEKKLMEEIYNTTRDRTTIIITHHHKSVSNCDKIYLMDNGKIIDEGKYADLENRHSL
jgi:ATP-binding cassette subfamily C protein